MSRIGKQAVSVPDGVTVTVSPENVVTVKGPKGQLSQKMDPAITLSQEDGKLTLNRRNDSKQNRAYHGLYRSLLANMVTGVTAGFKKELIIESEEGFRAEMAGGKLVLNVGYSHTVEIEPPEGITFETPKRTQIIVSGIDRQRVGQAAANIRAVRPPEPYKGKGIRYVDEHVRRKEGKTSS
ncbi:MAG: 50S ribosomal protein L6 [Christensenellales bacterium]|jgi:large subunit ribosomal protein L6